MYGTDVDYVTLQWGRDQLIAEIRRVARQGRQRSRFNGAAIN